MAFAKILPSGSVEHTAAVVNQHGHQVMAGFDTSELVNKVGIMTWNSDSLMWERATSTSIGSGGSTASPVTKRFDDQVTHMYGGAAAPGTAETVSGWSIQKFEYDVDGNLVAIKFASGIWTNRASLTYL